MIEAQNILRGDFIELNVSHDQYWMKHMYDIGKRYAVVWYDGCWPTEDTWNMALLETIDKWNKNEEPWAVAGHILLDRKLNAKEERMVLQNSQNWILHTNPLFDGPVTQQGPSE